MYKISEHAKQRYAERIMDREDKTDAALFVSQHQQKIQEDINKMVEFGEVIYTGVSTSDNNKNVVDVILNGHWVIIVDVKNEKVVTLFEIDLGLGKEFNDEYIARLKEKLDVAKARYKEEAKRLDKNNAEYNEIIDRNEEKIREYKSFIKSLETQNTNMVNLIAENKNNKLMAEQEVQDIVAVFCGKKVF